MFVHLHLHSSFSLSDSTIRLKSLLQQAYRFEMPALALTDLNNVFAEVKFFRAALKQGIKPIIGAEINVLNEADVLAPHRLVLLCQNKQGYKNLSQLISMAYQDGQSHGFPQIRKEQIGDHSLGLIALSAAQSGDVGNLILNNRFELAKQCVIQWQEIFADRYYLELVRNDKEHEEVYISGALALAADCSLPVVATNNVRFLKADDFESHEARVCIQEGRVLDDPRRPRQYTEQQYFKSAQQMAELFKDIPSAIENTLEIAKRCNFALSLGKNYLPNFPVPESKTMEQFFREEALNGLEEKFGEMPDLTEENRKVYSDRLDLEVETIVSMGFPGYFLIVADFIKWSKQNGIPVGPGRGSGAGSLVAYSMGITDLDPIENELLFERFLNPERVSLPDFDIDFCMDRRDEVIDYVARRYGREKVSQIITHGTMAAKAVVRDAGRVLSFPYGFVDQIAKLIPFEIGMTLEKALEQEAQLRDRYEQEEDVRAVLDLAKSLEGLPRNAGKHAGGIVIAPNELTDFMPLYCEPGSKSIVTQLDKDDVEAVGLVKFDFLGLRTLTIIDWALKKVNQNREKNALEPIDIQKIDLQDKKTFDLLKSTATTAVFQLESRGMKDLIKRLQPDCFDDIVALVALFRPGPLGSGMVDDFISRKHGRSKIDYPHEDLEPILRPTYGVILYQEQVMQIAQVLAGYTLGGADLLRRAMGKKKPEEMAKQREIFVNGATARSVDGSLAEYIFDLMEKFAGYGFNKSHSAAYALISYQTAWLKAHYPAEFMAAVLSADMDNTDKIVTLVDECRSMKLGLLPPSVNDCENQFTVREEEVVVYGLGAIKGVGSGAIETIVEARKTSGPFKDIYDFCRRVDLKKLNRRTIESLIRAGAFDSIEDNRAQLLAQLEDALQAADQLNQDSSSGQVDLFGNALQEIKSNITMSVSPMSEDDKLKGEKDTLGLYLTGHPIDKYEHELKQFISNRIVDLNPNKDQKIIIAGLVVALRTLPSKRGGRMAFASLDDKSGRIEIAIFTNTFEQYRDLVVKDQIIVVQGKVSVDEYSGGYKMSADKIFSLDGARDEYARRLVIQVNGEANRDQFAQSLAKILTPYKQGRCPVVVKYNSPDAQAQINLGDEWRVHPTNDLVNRLIKLTGKENIKIDY